MKKHHLIQALVLAGFLAFGVGRALAQEMEIDLGDTKAAPAAKPAQQAAPKAAAPSANQMEPPTPVPMKAEPAPQEKEQITEEVEVETNPEPVVKEVHGVLKATDYYEAGKKYYKKKEYDQAAKYWKKAIEKKDPYTPKYIYAEANAMLGVIYQFRIIHYKTAYHYYQAALKYEKGNKTAKKHIKEVLKKKKSRYWN